jgi:hypothetical protein
MKIPTKYIDHINFLEKKIYDIYNIYTNNNTTKEFKTFNKYSPYIFEYYSAIHMTNLFKKPFYVYKDFPKEKKIYENFPIRDKGIDIIDESCNIIGQSKYYSSENYITYGKLSTFLASEKLVGKNLSFYLIRTEHSLLDKDIKFMINNKIIKDIPINNDYFLEQVQIINIKYSNNSNHGKIL